MRSKNKTMLSLALTAAVFGACGFAALKTEAAQAEATKVKVEFTETKLPQTDGIWYAGGGNTYVASWNADRLDLCPGGNSIVAVKFTAPCDGYFSHTADNTKLFANNGDNTDGTRFAIIKEDTVIYPTSGAWVNAPAGEANAMTFETVETELQAGESFYYLCENGGNGDVGYDGFQIKAVFTWKDANNPDGVTVSIKDNYYYEAGTESENVTFGNYQKKDVFSYVRIYDYVAREVTEEEPVQPQPEAKKVEFVATKLPRTDGIWYAGGGNTFVASWNPEKLDICPAGDSIVAVKFTAPCDGTFSHAKDSSYVFAPNSAGDGTRFAVVKNDEIIYPATGNWVNVPVGEGNAHYFEIAEIALKAGDSIYYLAENGGKGDVANDGLQIKGNITWKDANNPDGVIVSLKDNYYYEDGTESENVTFGNYQKQDVFSYVRIYNYAEKNDALYMTVNSKALTEYNAATGERYTTEDSSKSKNDSGHWGIYSGTMNATANVITVPANVTGTHTLEACNFNIINGVAGTYFAILHQKAGSSEAKIVYPANGTWRDLGEADTVSKVAVAATAGDKLYIAMFDSTGNGYNAYLPICVNIDGVYWDATKTPWYNPADGENTCAYFGGTYKYSEIVSYEYFPVKFAVNYDLDGGENNAQNPAAYCTLMDTELAAPTKAGATFTGWVDANGNAITKIAKGTNGAVSVKATWESCDANITKTAVSLGEDISMKFYVTADAGFEVTGLKVNFKGMEETITAYTEENGMYVYKFDGIAPQYLNEKVTATVIGSSNTVSVSVQDYLVALMNTSKETLGYSEAKYAAMKQLAVDLLYYGAAAQTYVNVNVENLATSVLTEEQTASEFVKPEASDLQKTGETNAEYRWYQAGVSYSNKIGLYFVVAAKDEVSLKVTNGTNTVELTECEKVGEKDGLNLYKFYYNGVTLTQFDNVLSVEIFANGAQVGQMLSYSVKSNVYALSDSGNYAALLQRAYMYGVSAKAFADAE